MYIECKKDFNKVLFNFKEGIKYPITAIFEDSYAFDNPITGENKTIAKSYLNENNQYLEFKNERACNHSNVVNVYDYVICAECNEIIYCEHK